MKVFEIKKFSFVAVNPNIFAGSSDNIQLPANSSAFDISIEVEINHPKTINDIKQKNNIQVIDNLVIYNAKCLNNEIVMSVYDYVERNSNTDSLTHDFAKLINTLNLWTV